MHPDYTTKDIPQSTELRFWAKVQRQGRNECWEWQGSRTPNGYGKFSVKRKDISAHRFSYQLHYGPIPDGMLICHRCDNPACVNPYHLFAGTQVENLADMATKGRRPIGEQAPNAKLTEKDVISIRTLYSTGVPQRQLSRQFKISRPQIRRIIRHESWRQIP
jgi:hypothetical protein